MPLLLTQVLATALDETNTWFAELLGRPDLSLQLLDAGSARRVASEFERAGGGRRKVTWNWEDLYFRRVKMKNAWMYAIVRAGRPRAMCYGRIEVHQGFVSLEYLERTPYARGLRGIVAPSALQFARTVALLLELDEVRLNKPFRELVRYYERELGVIRHPAVGEVQYLYCKAKP